MFGIDTFSWTKIFMLIEESWEEILIEWVKSINFFITKEVKVELIHFHGSKINLWNEGAMLPALNVSFQDYLKLGFDSADASLLEYSEKSEYKIITEDGPMLNLNVYKRNNIIQLIDLFRISYTHGFFSKREYFSLIIWFRKNRNITLKKERNLKKNILQ